MNWVKRRRWAFLLALGLVFFNFYRTLPAGQAPDGFKVIKHYDRNDYDNLPQNWWILQDRQGIVYVGNLGGLMLYDGVSWEKIAIDNHTVRSMAMDDNGTIYIGGRGEIGYLEPGDDGSPRYRSLVEHLPPEARNFSAVYQSFHLDGAVFFRTKKYLFRWRHKSFKIWRSETSFRPSFLIGGRLYIQQQHKGFYLLEDDLLEPIPNTQSLSAAGVYMMAPHGREHILTGARQGLFLFDGDAATPFPCNANDYLIKSKIYCGIRLSSGDYAIGTSEGGIVIIDDHGNLKTIYDKESGLNDNSVKYIFEDRSGNIWAGLNVGVAKIENNSPFSYYDARSGLTGIVHTVSRFKERLLAGTSDGLFALSPEGSFEKIPNISRHCWSLLPTGDSLLAATTAGVFLLNRQSQKKIHPDNTYALHPCKNDRSRILMATVRGPAILSPSNWQTEKNIGGIDHEIHTIAEDNRGNVWLGTKEYGVFKLDYSSSKDYSQPTVHHYYTGHNLPNGETNVSIAAGRPVFATVKGLYRFDVKQERFVADSLLGDEFCDGSRGVFRVMEDSRQTIWFHSENQNFQALPKPDGAFGIIRTPFLRLPKIQVNSFFSEPTNHTLWLSGNEGLIRYDTAQKKDDSRNFPVKIRAIRINNKPAMASFIDAESGPEPSIPEFPHKQRNIRFQFAALFFEAEDANQYASFLEGYDNDWSEWTNESHKDYTNLDAGIYTFRVNGRNIFGHTGTEASIRFRILPPWYQTWWAIALFILAFAGLGLLLLRLRVRSLEKDKRRLEHIIDRRTSQLKEQAEKLKELDQVKSRFFANISHEFRTPLTLIMGPVEQMKSQTNDRAQKDKFDLILRNARRLISLINRLLNLSRIDSGKLKLKAGHNDFIPFIKGILASFTMLAQQRHIDLTFTSTKDSIFVYFNPENLEECITNLLVNAVKFTPTNGKITVALRTVIPNSPAKQYPEGYLEISIRDTGIGIPKEQVAYIFDRFYQADQPENSEPLSNGSGIGLALSKELVCLHHGEIDVQSGEGTGTEFIIRLPLGKHHLKPEEIAPPNGTLQPSQPSPKKTAEILDLHAPKQPHDSQTIEEPEDDSETQAEPQNVILIVEDDADVRSFIRSSLDQDYRVVEAVNGKDGIDLAKKIIPDLIISDVMMPEMDGFQLCRHLKTNIDTSHIPIILLTARAGEESVVQGLKTGADDYITKPFNTKILITRIQNLIDLRRQLQLKIQRKKMLLPQEIEVSSMDKEFLTEITNLLEKNLSDPNFHLEQLCTALYMSRSTLFRKIQALTGETPNQFIRTFRLQRAAQLLRDRFGNVSEVALEVGFQNFAYFAKLFKEKFHQLPSTYQSQHTKPTP